MASRRWPRPCRLGGGFRVRVRVRVSGRFSRFEVRRSFLRLRGRVLLTVCIRVCVSVSVRVKVTVR